MLAALVTTLQVGPDCAEREDEAADGGQLPIEVEGQGDAKNQRYESRYHATQASIDRLRGDVIGLQIEQWFHMRLRYLQVRYINDHFYSIPPKEYLDFRFVPI